MSIIEQHIWNGKQSIVTWHGADFHPPRESVTQTSGVCFTEDGSVVLVSSNGTKWSLPGGHTEEGESIEETLIREVREEACAKVVDLEYLGAQEVREQHDGKEQPPYFQTRFWALITLREFKQDYEIRERKLVNISGINTVLRWNPSGILDEIVTAALEVEKAYSKQITMKIIDSLKSCG